MSRRRGRRSGRTDDAGTAERPLRVLLVTHETTLSGAPRIALLVVRALAAQGHQVRVVARAPGPMLQEFAAEAPTSLELLGHLRGVLWSRLGPGRVPLIVDTFLALVTLLARRPDLVYVNSTSAAVYVRPARWLRRSVVLHFHESEAVARSFLDATRSHGLLPAVTVIACSPSVRRDVARLTGSADADVPLLPSVPDDAAVERLAQRPPDHQYDEAELVVGCCGTVEHRKGTDLWVAAAKRVLAGSGSRRPVRFVWVGPAADASLGSPAPGIDFLGASANPYPHMRRFDVATLPSRDDPFPLVVLESMLLGTPVVAFGVGGVPDQIGEAGLVVPPGDVDAFADAVAHLLDDDAERRRLGSAAQERVRGLYSTRAFTEQLTAVLEGAVHQDSRPS